MSIQALIDAEAERAPARFASRDFKALQAAWYARLAASGFVDAEAASLGIEGGRITRERRVGWPTAEYHRLTGWWCHDAVWASRRDWLVWSLHAEGATVREIVATLGTLPAVTLGSVQRVIQRARTALRRQYAVRGEGREG